MEDQNVVFNMDQECSICLESLKGKRVEILECLHGFHYDCVEKWLRKRKGSCPKCRSDVSTSIQDDDDELLMLLLSMISLDSYPFLEPFEEELNQLLSSPAIF
jgi:hypothetical protein